jgi:hypothetical protein
MYKIILLFVLLSSLTTQAQKELWGVNTGAEYTLGYFGKITEYDMNGEKPAIMYEFDSIHGFRLKEN